MKISKVILTLCSILIILGLISFIFPEDGLVIGGLKLTFPSLNEILSDNMPLYADIDAIVEQTEEHKSEEKEIKRVKIKTEGITDIELPEDNPAYLDNFFAALDNSVKDNDKVRIIHYGDSQIEGDRITSYLRTRLQDKFGGTGQGEIPLYSLSNIKNFSFKYSDGWHFYSIIDNKKTGFHRYGLMQSAAVADGNDEYITLTAAKPIQGEISLYYGFASPNSRISFFSGNDELKSYSLTADSSLNKISFRAENPIKSFTVKVEGHAELYSMDFSGKNGVYVDNVSLRGSSGYGFSKNNSEFLKSMSVQLNVKLIILQFGVNAVPQDEQEIMPSYHFYKVQFAKQIAYLKKTNPDAAIIVIGISDRSRKKGNDYQTNPNIPMILAAQKDAAKENQVAFWNLFEAMGGENSMPSWVLREKPLANPDFTHFNSTGAKYVGEMFYKALESAYNYYKQ